jgi:hypothetical protein
MLAKPTWIDAALQQPTAQGKQMTGQKKWRRAQALRSGLEGRLQMALPKQWACQTAPR